jgi:hypothetical protein
MQAANSASARLIAIFGMENERMNLTRNCPSYA